MAHLKIKNDSTYWFWGFVAKSCFTTTDPKTLAVLFESYAILFLSLPVILCVIKHDFVYVGNCYGSNLLTLGVLISSGLLCNFFSKHLFESICTEGPRITQILGPGKCCVTRNFR